MQEGAHFTIDFIEQQYRQSVQMLMEILCIDIGEAYGLFLESGCNTQAAINRKTNPSPEKHNFQNPVPHNTRGRVRRNGAISNYPDEMENLYENLDHQDESEEEFHSLPAARRRAPVRVSQETQFDAKFNKLLQKKKKKKSFDSKYIVRKQLPSESSRSIGMKIFDKKPKKLEEKKILNIRPFFKEIEKGLVQKMITIKFGKGSMSETLEQCLRTFNPLLAYHLNFDREENANSNTNASKNSKHFFKPKKMVIDITDDNDQDEKMVEVDESKNSDEIVFEKSEKNLFLKSLLTDKKFERVANDSFLNYIFDMQNYELESYFKEYFQKSTRKQSNLVVLRVNYLEDIEFVGKIKLDEVIERLKQKDQKATDQQIANIVDQLKKFSEKCKSIQKQEDQLFERYNLFQRGVYNFDYKKQPTTAQKIKVKEDREIIKQQQEEFMHMQNEFIEQQIKELVNQQPQKQKISKDDIIEKRTAVREGLKKYNEGDPDIMMVKFRLPSGKNILLHVSIKEKIAYLFDYIFSHEMENIGFEQEEDGGYCERQFDIIRPEDRLSLETKLGASLQELFEGSPMESVIVKEKS